MPPPSRFAGRSPRALRAQVVRPANIPASGAKRNLQKERYTTGCIAAKNDQDWQRVRDLIRRTRTKTVNDNPRPWWKIWGGRESINYFGTLTVR